MRPPVKKPLKPAPDKETLDEKIDRVIAADKAASLPMGIAIAKAGKPLASDR